MATPNSDDGVPVNLENGGGGGRCGEFHGGQNADKATAIAKKKPKEQGCSSNSHAVLGLVILVMYYVFFVFYMVSFSEKWWHAALAIAAASASLVLSFYLVARQINATSPGEQNVVKSQDGDGDLGRILLASENLQDNASVRGIV